MDQHAKATAFRRMHLEPPLLVLPNAWDVGSAKALAAIDPERDVELVRGPVDELDHASPFPCYGSKMGIDATRKWPSEGYTRTWPPRIRTTEQAARRAAELLRRP